MKLIRKISIGQDYKNEAMHYSVGQEVYGGHTICDIIEEDNHIRYLLKKMTRCCHGNILILIWQYLLNII